MVNDAAEGTIKFASDFTNVIMTNRARWLATMHEVETQKFTLEPKKQCFFKILVKIALDYAIVIVITFYSPSCLGQETAKGAFGLLVKLPPAHLSTTHGGGFTLSLLMLNVKQESCEYQFL